MDEMDALRLSEESQQKIRDIHRLPLVLRYGKYKLSIEGGRLRFFLYEKKRRPIKSPCIKTVPTFSALPKEAREQELIGTFDDGNVYRYSSGKWVCAATGVALKDPISGERYEEYYEEVEVPERAWCSA